MSESLSGWDVLIRKVVEHGQVIFPEAFCLTEQERLEKESQGIHLESIERLKSSNRSKFFGQYLNDPMDDAMLEFKREWFQQFNIQPGSPLASEFPIAPVLISIDPAFRMKQTNDDSGIVVTKTLSDNNVYVLEAKGIKVNPKMLVDEVFKLVDKYQFVDKVLLETVTSQIMLMDLIQDEMRKRGKFFVIQEVKPDSNETKAARIRSLIPHYSNRRIFHSSGMYALEEQLMEFPKGMHDDIIDALSYQVKYWRPFNFSESHKDYPHGSFGWWKSKTSKPLILGGLFNDFKNKRT